jgi:hypothetical protein
MSTAEAYAAAVARVKQMQADGLSLPLQLKNGVVVEALGAVDPRPSFSTPLGLMTPGFRAVFKDSAAGRFVSEIKAPPGAKHPQFVVSLIADPQALAAIAEHHSSAATGRTSVPGLAEQQQQQGAGDAAGTDKAAAGAAESRQFELASARNADMAWAQVVGLQERARMQVDAAAAAADTLGSVGSGSVASASLDGAAGAASGAAAAAAAAAAAQAGSRPHVDAPLDPLLAQLLCKANSLKGCWGKAMFGLADADVLALLEALPGADATPNYQFVDERGGWKIEREFLAKGRWAKRSMLQAGMKKPASKKQQGGQQSPAATPAAAAAKAALGAAAPGSGGGAAAASRKRPHSASGGGIGGGAPASDSVLFSPEAASKRYKGMGKEEREVAGAVDHVLDKMVRKLEVWWGHETAREAKKAEKAQARAAAQEAKKAAKEAAKAEVGMQGDGAHGMLKLYGVVYATAAA